MNFKNVVFLLLLTCGTMIRAEDAIKWESAQHPGPRGKGAYSLVAIGSAATALAAVGFGYVMYKAQTFQKLYKEIKKHPYSSAATLAASVAVILGALKYQSLPKALVIK